MRVVKATLKTKANERYYVSNWELGNRAKYPSISEIKGSVNKWLLKIDYSKIPQDILEKAQLKGKAVHSFIEMRLNQSWNDFSMDDISPEAKELCGIFNKAVSTIPIFSVNKMANSYVEVPLIISNIEKCLKTIKGYGGTADFVNVSFAPHFSENKLLEPNVLTIIDFKTTSNFEANKKGYYPMKEAFIQLIALQEMWENYFTLPGHTQFINEIHSINKNGYYVYTFGKLQEWKKRGIWLAYLNYYYDQLTLEQAELLNEFGKWEVEFSKYEKVKNND